MIARPLFFAFASWIALLSACAGSGSNGDSAATGGSGPNGGAANGGASSGGSGVDAGVPACSPTLTPVDLGTATNRTATTHVAVDQFGYTTVSEKVAVVFQPITGYDVGGSFAPATTYEVRRSSDGSTAFSGPLVGWNSNAVHDQSGDRVWWFDFSALETPGKYYVIDPSNGARSDEFTVDDGVYYDVLKQAVRAFYYQRCGTAKDSAHAGANWTDTACHVGNGQDRAARSVLDQNNAGTAKDLSGGWHDAGDYTKYVNFTHSTLNDLLDAYVMHPQIWRDDTGIPESGNGVPDLLDEIKWELDWVLKMQLADGSVLMKVGTAGNDGPSPPSGDGAPRFYGPPELSSTLTLASVASHAALVFRDVSSLSSYAATLEAAATRAWDWATAHPTASTYDNQGFSSANPEQSAYEQQSTRGVAATYLFALTGDSGYATVVDSTFQTRAAKTRIDPFESTIQNALLFYQSLPNATAATAKAIATTVDASVRAGSENYPTVRAKVDAFRAYLKDGDYVWGSNQIKAQKGILYLNMRTYGIDPANREVYGYAAAGFLHYLHGVNPNAMVYLSNMRTHGAEHSANEMFHSWFGNGSRWDSAASGTGPAPGYLTGGANPKYRPDSSCGCDSALIPPLNQPVQKAYRDWNTSWPENSWEVTEPAIYYQAAYVKLLSAFVGGCAEQ